MARPRRRAAGGSSKAPENTESASAPRRRLRRPTSAPDGSRWSSAKSESDDVEKE
jgi:hypothetical protein